MLGVKLGLENGQVRPKRRLGRKLRNFLVVFWGVEKVIEKEEENSGFWVPAGPPDPVPAVWAGRAGDMRFSRF